MDGVRQRLGALSGARRVALMVGAAMAIALIAGLFLWSREPSWKILFSNVPDKEGGAIVQSLQQMNVPYKLDAGGTIQVPSDKVYDARLKLAAQGLPKAGGVGFELMDNQKFGISQFAEQVNYQRAVEGELARSIETISAVERARVHLAFPKQTVFLRDQQKPSASVVLTLRRGRQIDNAQVAGIVHLVSSSVPDLPIQNVKLVDQNGNLLSRGINERTHLDPNQLQYVQLVERGFVDRIETILSPIVGRENLKAEVTAQLDFAEINETSEKFRPNGPPNIAAIRSQQTLEQQGRTGNEVAAGVPGALSNQPPGAATAPITAPVASAASAVESTTSANSRKEATTNYELDKTIQHVKQPVGGVKRLSVAVVVNYKATKNQDGQDVTGPLSQQEMDQISALVREAVGYNQQRGDTVNVVNAAFAKPAPEAPPTVSGRAVDYVKTNTIEVAKVALIALVVLYLLFFVVRPLMKDMSRTREAARTIDLEIGHEEEERVSPFEAARMAESEEDQVRMSAFADLLQQAKEVAKNDPRMVATILREWMASGEESGGDANKKG
ncbi:flagellar M-ring protein FliF [Formivibrio citricus]|uniref:Flagellar M-ring protein n=1 Tax=Formivibrio citricus TaxID=83765 RepID=A0A1I5B8Y6_9NEIS|nr:flagellar basal-body MS-ring/collar protein FliF [Formivibrio citricus]SFN71184.1 flagellar M-ring protein FliF [Formivibrio citricus]